MAVWLRRGRGVLRGWGMELLAVMTPPWLSRCPWLLHLSRCRRRVAVDPTETHRDSGTHRNSQGKHRKAHRTVKFLA